MKQTHLELDLEAFYHAVGLRELLAVRLVNRKGALLQIVCQSSKSRDKSEPHHRNEEVAQALVIGRLARMRLDANQKTPLKVHQSVKVDKDGVDLIPRDDFHL